MIRNNMPTQKPNKQIETEACECDTESNNGDYLGPKKSEDTSGVETMEKEEVPLKWKICWRLVFFVTLEHVTGLYGGYLLVTKATWITRLFWFLVLLMGFLGVTAGVHRLWSHRSYKARRPLQIILASFYLLTFQHSILYWARDHRVHHKFSETDADPHNARRGFFYAHIGWLLLKKQPEVLTKGRRVDLSDLLNDKLVMFIEKYYDIITLIHFLIPTYVPALWGESVWTAFFINWLRILVTFHMAALINSAAHLWGRKPYDKNIGPVENNIASFLSIGEGFHNYHHTYPFDYKAAELGHFSLNLTRYFIQAMAAIGWAYDLKTVDKNIIKQKVQRTGDGSHPVWGNI